MFERFTPTARRVVVGAIREAERQRATHVTGEHLLLSLADSPGTAGKLLAHFDVKREGTVAAFREAQRRGGLSEADTEALRELGIDVDHVVDNVERSLGPGALSDAARPRRRFLVTRTHIPFSTEAKEVLEHTLQEALDLGDRRLQEEHILLALLRRGVSAEILGKHGMTNTSVRSQLRRAEAS